MRLVEPSVEVLDYTHDALQLIELCGRVCYKSEDKITEDSAERFVRQIMKSGHESVLEHAKATVRVVCDRGVSHEIVRHRLASYSQESTRYCVAGNTKLSMVRGKVTVKEIYDNIQQSTNGAYKRMLIKQLNEDTGEIVFSKIKNVYKTGVKKVYEIKTHLGYTLHCTPEHEIYTPKGYTQLQDLNIGDKVFVNGVDCTIPYRNYDWLYYQNITLNKTFKDIADEFGYNVNTVKKWARILGVPKKGTGYFNEGRTPWNKGLKESDDPRVKKQGDSLRKYHCNGRHDNEFIILKEDTVNYQKYNKHFCEICNCTEDIEVHHIDQDRGNNSPSNLISVCSSCHQRIHNRSLTIAHADEIVSITDAGETEVYDIEMNSEYHNFVANGVIVHNCNYKGDIAFIKPMFSDVSHYQAWLLSVRDAEEKYHLMLARGAKPEEARSVLPNSLKTEIVMTMNLREWRHFFKLRLSKRAHPQMREVAALIYTELRRVIPIVFDELEVQDT